MSKSYLAVIALALIIIAGNMTYTNINSPAATTTSAESNEKVLPVVGRVWVTLDNLASAGFLLKDGNHLKIARYDAGSMAANDAFQPKYMTEVRHSNGQVTYNPIMVDQWH